MASRYNFFYLIEIQYLGFRYHGWQFQHDVKTLQGMVERTVNFIFEDKKFKVLGSGRTDAMVSAQSSFFELFTNHEVDTNDLCNDLNVNLPPDIKVISCRVVDNQFNIIRDVERKTYHYYFASVEEKYPFAAPFMNCIPYPLDIVKMKEAARLFEGKHEFKYFMSGDAENKNTIREIQESRIDVNEELTANFFPAESFVYRISGKGFMRYQIRMMMGALIRIGRNEISLEDIKNTLQGNPPPFEKSSAAASGLMVKNVKFKQ